MSFYDRVMKRYMPVLTSKCDIYRMLPDAFLNNSNTTLEFILSHPEIIDINDTKGFGNYKFNQFVTSTRNITINTVLAHPEIKWELTHLAKCPGITVNDVLAHPELPWNYEELSENPHLTWEIVYNNPSIEWDINKLMINPALGCQESEVERRLDEIT